MSRTTSSTILPAVPVIPVTPVKAGKGKKRDETVEATPAAVPKPAPVTPLKTPQRAVKEAVVAEKKEEKVKIPPTTPAAKETSKPKTTGKKGKAIIEPAPKKESSKEIKKVEVQKDVKPVEVLKEVKPAPAAPSATPNKRSAPGILDLTAAIKAQDENAKGKTTGTASAATSVPPSPATTSTGSPIKRSVAPRTLRVIPTPKTETPPPLSASTAPPLPQLPTVDKLRSRQASIASVNQPGTPYSDLISDTASVTSTSVSRANSPPPVLGSKVGTAPVRKKTKSQAKKDRQERRRQIEEEQTIMDDKSDNEVVQAPIIGRKKKTKKPSAPVPKPAAVAPKSEPASPKPATVEEEVSDAPAPVIPSRKVSSAMPSVRPSPEPEQDPLGESAKDKREYTPQSVMSDLQKTGQLLASTLEFFKPLSSSLTHSSRNPPVANVAAPQDLKIHFSEADLEALAKKKPVRLNSHAGKPDSRTLITPHGKFFWGLTEELEQRALELERSIGNSRGPACFHAHKQSATGQDFMPHQQSKDVLPAIATALKEAGKKLNTGNSPRIPKLDASSIPLPPVQPGDAANMQGQQSPHPQQTPADAGLYLNQFVLPKTDNPPPNQPRPEMAAVGGAPGAGTASVSSNINFAKAAQAVVEGGAVGSTMTPDGMSMMAADLLGGVFVHGLEALVGAGLGFQPGQDIDGKMGRGAGLDVQGLMSAIESTAGYVGTERRGRGSVLSMEEAEQAMLAARKEHDVLEKKLAALIKKNRKVAGAR